MLCGTEQIQSFKNTWNIALKSVCVFSRLSWTLLILRGQSAMFSTIFIFFEKWLFQVRRLQSTPPRHVFPFNPGVWLLWFLGYISVQNAQCFLARTLCLRGLLSPRQILTIFGRFRPASRVLKILPSLTIYHYNMFPPSRVRVAKHLLLNLLQPETKRVYSTSKTTHLIICLWRLAAVNLLVIRKDCCRS